MRKGISFSSVLLVLLASLSSCGREERPRELLTRYLNAMKGEPRAFVYREETADQKITVRGQVEDDLRQSGLLQIDGTEAMEQIVSDDTLAVRVMDASKVEEVRSPALAGKIGDTLAGGGWVVDYAGAPPPLAPKTKEGVFDLGKNHILDAFYVIQYIERAIGEAAGVIKFNPDSLGYIPAEDPFPQADKGGDVTRYDIVAPPLPRRNQRGTAAALPTISNFRKMAFYVKDGKVIRILEEIDFESHRDFKRARRGDGPTYPLQILAAVRAGRAREPIRTRTMAYEVSKIGSEIHVTLPPQFLAATIGGVFGPTGFSLVFPGVTAPTEAQTPSGEPGATATATASG